MRVPFIELTREWAYFEDRFIRQFTDFGRSGSYVLGKFTEEFERNFARYCGYEYAVSISTGLSALEVSLLAHGIAAGDEVITVANSAVATSLAISNIGAKPIFCDIGDDFLISPDQIEPLITTKTKAILPVHLFGKVCNMHAINEIASKHDLLVIEDACQAHGAGFKEESRLNTKAFSFYPTKNLGALGEGGMIVTNNEKVKDFASSYRNYGQKERYNHLLKGNNYRIDALQCVFLNAKLQELDNFISKRREIAKRYIQELSEIESLKLNGFDKNSSYHLFVIRVLDGKRDALKNHLEENGIDSLVHYPTPIHQQLCYAGEYPDLSLQNTDKFQAEILSLPCYPFLAQDEQDYVIDKIKSFFS